MPWIKPTSFEENHKITDFDLMQKCIWKLDKKTSVQDCELIGFSKKKLNQLIKLKTTEKRLDLKLLVFYILSLCVRQSSYYPVLSVCLLPSFLTQGLFHQMLDHLGDFWKWTVSSPKLPNLPGNKRTNKGKHEFVISTGTKTHLTCS